ncbi:MAG: hypothetical protein RIG63_03650 [Coleofasciculus chthonoplastes F3-SA18-01]
MPDNGKPKLLGGSVKISIPAWLIIVCSSLVLNQAQPQRGKLELPPFFLRGNIVIELEGKDKSKSKDKSKLKHRSKDK